MDIEECIIKSKEWLREMKYNQLAHTLCGEVNHDLDKTVEGFEELLNCLEDFNDFEDSHNEKISTLKDECYKNGYNQAIEDVVFELNNQGVDSDIITLIEGM